MSVRSLAAAFLVGLEEQCKLRKDRGGFLVNEDGRPELAWVLLERQFMHQQVNIERAGLHKPAVPIVTIRRVETMASGHIDYTRKFARYCAELVLCDEEPRP